MARLDLAGSWSCSRVEGDWDAFLKTQDIGWVKRRAAQAMGYGVGKQTQQVELDESSSDTMMLTMVSSGPGGAQTIRLTIGGGETQQDDGKMVGADWDGTTLVIRFRAPSSSPGSVNLTGRRYLLPTGECAVEMTPEAGATVTRIFERVEGTTGTS